MVEFLVPLSSAVFVSGRNALIRTLRDRVSHAAVLLTNFLITGTGAVILLLFSLPATVAPAFYWSIPIATVALIGGRTALIAGTLFGNALINHPAHRILTASHIHHLVLHSW